MRRSLLTLAFTLLTILSFSQRLHVGVFGGLAAYNGDLTEKIYPKKMTNGVIGASLNYELTDNFMLRGQLSYAVVGGDDKYSDNAELRQRNLNFESRILEASLVAEYYLLNLYDNRFSPYVFAGLGFYHATPYTYSPTDGNKVYLRPLRTEGQGLPGYTGLNVESNFQMNIPLGAGVKYAISDKVHLGLELGIRKLFTDHFDDVSTAYADPADLLAGPGGILAVQYSYRGDELPGGNPAYPAKAATRGGSRYKDLYYFTGLHLTYRLDFSNGLFGGKDRNGCPPRPY